MRKISGYALRCKSMRAQRHREVFLLAELRLDGALNTRRLVAVAKSPTCRACRSAGDSDGSEFAAARPSAVTRLKNKSVPRMSSKCPTSLMPSTIISGWVVSRSTISYGVPLASFSAISRGVTSITCVSSMPTFAYPQRTETTHLNNDAHCTWMEKITAHVTLCLSSRSAD